MFFIHLCLCPERFTLNGSCCGKLFVTITIIDFQTSLDFSVREEVGNSNFSATN
jgi:hypothetical protein